MSRDRGTTASPQPEEGRDHSRTAGDWRRVTAGIGEPYPDEIVPFDELRSADATVAFPHAVRKRITEAVVQTRRIVAERVEEAQRQKRPQAVATQHGLISEIREIRIAEQRGTKADLRAAYMAAAASCILLGEAADRPEIKSRYREVRDERKTERKRERGWK